MSRRHRRLSLALCVALTAAGLTVATAGPVGAASKTTAKAMLSQLTEKTYSRDWYSQEQFGKFGKSKKSKCRDIRAEVLAADAIGPMPKTCKTSGLEWKDPFTGATFSSGFPGVIPLVPVDDAWESGAGTWDRPTRVAYLNDVAFDGTLIVVPHKSSEARQDEDPARWLPKKAAVRCAYVTQWISVKYRWRLSVDTAEKQALTKAVARCPAKKIPAVKRAKIALTPVATPTPTPVVSPTPSLNPRKNTCAELAAANLGPYVRDTDPEYAWYRDDDGDGNACEAKEGVLLSPSNDWQTERYTRSATPKITVALTKQPDPAGGPNMRGVLHARVLSGGTEVWRGANDFSVAFDGMTQELNVYPALADGPYVAQVWSSYSYDVDEAAPATATTLTFIVDTQAPDAPTYVGGATGGTAVSDAADVRAIRFTYADYPHDLAAAPGQPVVWSAPYYSGPDFELRVQAWDRAGNMSAAVTR